MKKILLFLFSLVLIFSSKIFATYPGYPDLNAMPEPSAPAEDLVYPDYVLFGVEQPQSTSVAPFAPPFEDEGVVDGGDNFSGHLYPQLDNPEPIAPSPRSSSGWWRWFVDSRPVSWIMGKRQGVQANLVQNDPGQQAILDVTRHELDEQMAWNLQHEEELRARDNILRKQEEERLSETEVVRILIEESNVGVEPGRPLVFSAEKNREVEMHIDNVLSRINTLEDLHLLCEEFGMSNEKVDDLTSILGANYLENFGELTISPEGKVCVREFISSHIEELSG